MWNKENGKDLVAIADTYISPIRLYSGKNGEENMAEVVVS